MAALEAEVSRIAGPIEGITGIVARRLDGKGSILSVNGHELFPMASTYKIAIACTVLSMIDAGELALDQTLCISPEGMVASGIIAENFVHRGVSLSIHNLLEVMLTHSDNSATDALIAAVGGPSSVTSWLRNQGILDQRVDRDTAEIIGDFLGFERCEFAAQMAAAKKSNLQLDVILDSPKAEFDNDPRDSSTPMAMAELLRRIFCGESLSAKSTETLVAIMERCKTGPGRLRGRLPPGTVVAHKTGTIGGTVNDAGVITLPDDGGKVIVVVFIKKSAATIERREVAIADIARSVLDFFLFAGYRE